jgi:hypothetical protein
VIICAVVNNMISASRPERSCASTWSRIHQLIEDVEGEDHFFILFRLDGIAVTTMKFHFAGQQYARHKLASSRSAATRTRRIIRAAEKIVGDSERHQMFAVAPIIAGW